MDNTFEKGDRVVGVFGGVARRGSVQASYTLWENGRRNTYYVIFFDNGGRCYTMQATQMQRECPLEALALCGGE